MFEGYTMEEDREIMYKDLVDKGDLEGAKVLRAYQDAVHPMKSAVQVPPKSPTRASPPT